MASLADATPPIALGALDGRYRGTVAPLVDHLSEAALNRQRVHVEIEWLIHQTSNGVVPGVRTLTDDEIAALRAVVDDFGIDEVAELGEIERVTVHDVKAVEYFLKKRLTAIAPADGDKGLAELIHFGCTSEDINNLSYALMVKGAVKQVWLPRARALVAQVAEMARELKDVPLLAHTHGQPATPTTMGKELAVLAHRLGRQLRRIEGQEYLGKFNGATGTYGAHALALPDNDWPVISRAFVEGLGLPGTRSRPRSRATTGRRSSTPTSPASTASCTTSAPTCGPTSRSATSRRCAARAPSGRARCRTRSTRSASRTPRPTSR